MGRFPDTYWGDVPARYCAYTPFHFGSLTDSSLLVICLLVLWSFAAWSTGPTQQFNLVQIEPNYSGIMLSLNQSMMQLSMAAGAGFGGIIVNQVSLSSVTWFGMIGVIVAMIIVFILKLRMSRGNQEAQVKSF